MQDTHSISINDVKINEIIQLKYRAQCSVHHKDAMLVIILQRCIVLGFLDHCITQDSILREY